MNIIKLEDFNPNMGVLISVEDKDDYVPYKNSININVNKLLDNPSRYLDKSKTYYIYCEKGIKSKRAVQILSVYGYKVVKVIK